MWGVTADYLQIENLGSLHLLPEGLQLRYLTLPGDHNRRNARLVIELLKDIHEDVTDETILEIFGNYPGTQRRMEKLADNVYTDYAHHPNEIAATLNGAVELNENVIVVYQPHQNVRQHKIIDQYQDCFELAEQVYWLPTYLSREIPQLLVLKPEEMIPHLSDPSIAEPSHMDEELIGKLRDWHQQGRMILFMSAGNLDTWARTHFTAE